MVDTSADGAIERRGGAMSLTAVRPRTEDGCGSREPTGWPHSAPVLHACPVSRKVARSLQQSANVALPVSSDKPPSSTDAAMDMPSIGQGSAGAPHAAHVWKDKAKQSSRVISLRMGEILGVEDACWHDDHCVSASGY